MVEVFGKQAVTAWLDPLIVGKDDGTEIELWCPTQLFVDTVDSEFRPKIEEILDRKIKGIVRNLKALEVTRRADQIRSER